MRILIIIILFISLECFAEDITPPELSSPPLSPEKWFTYDPKEQKWLLPTMEEYMKWHKSNQGPPDVKRRVTPEDIENIKQRFEVWI